MSTPRWMLWTGRVMSALPVLFMLVAAVPTLIHPEQAREGVTHVGYPPDYARGIVLLQMACALVYVIPQTAVLGAILLTGYLGGATASHVRIGELGKAFVPVTFGVVVWLGLLLRDARVRMLLPFRTLGRRSLP